MNIQVTDVKVYLPPTERLLFHIRNFHLNSGEHLLIQGASGQGKTTLLHLIAGLFVPNSGQVNLGNYALHQMSDAQRSEFRRQYVGLVFQKLNLIEHLTAVENVQLSLKGFAEAEKLSLKALEAVGLSDKAYNWTSVLSLGEQQRVAVARVLARQPELILADEPTSSLDEKNSSRVIELLLQAAKNQSCIVVSHDHRLEKYFSKIIHFEDLLQ